MRINNTARTNRAGSGSAPRRAGGSTGFTLGSTEKAGQAQQPRAARSIAGVDALLAVQGVDNVGDATSGKTRAMRRGHSMLDTLEDLKLDLLGGTISPEKLKRLLRLVQDKDEEGLDPALAGVLDEIELRARVELAKHDNHRAG